MFVGLTQTEATRIVTMASAEIHPIDIAAAQQQSEATVFAATDTPHPSAPGGDNDVADQPPTTVNKDDAADKKRKAVEATPSTPTAQRPKANEDPQRTPTQPDATRGQASGSPDLHATRGQASLTNTNDPPPASDKIEDWLDDDTAADQGFIRTGRKTYRPPLPNLYTGPEVDDDLLDGHDWVYKEHGKALRHTKEPPPS